MSNLLEVMVDVATTVVLKGTPCGYMEDAELLQCAEDYGMVVEGAEE